MSVRPEDQLKDWGPPNSPSPGSWQTGGVVDMTFGDLQKPSRRLPGREHTRVQAGRNRRGEGSGGDQIGEGVWHNGAEASAGQLP